MTARPEPVDAVEESVLRHVSDVLGRPDISLDADFFSSGGDSLSAIALADGLSDELGVELSLDSIFDALSVREIADAVREAPPADAGRG